MDNKENSFGDMWWHRILNLVFFGSHIFLFVILILASGGIGYAITESESFSSSLGLLISEATSIAILGFCILILETIRFIFFYIYTNKKSGFKKDLYTAFRRQSTIIVLI
ncbi:MAG TPA: hypothetical protein PK295_03450, partial [Candidatus Magasanikbacteria bacterium]|nr:hypothetical protein [Candidatus Magasanikbacteria bacterium]